MTLFKFDAADQRLATMTTLPAYPCQYSGMIQFMGLVNITCGHDYAVLGQITADYQV